ncbi:MAG: glycosyl hydrolase family 28 protein [Armatimonadota bacterium]
MSIVTWPAPAEEIPSPDYTVEVDGCPVFVYQARVRAEILQNDGLWTHRPDPAGERASFAIFDMTAPVTVIVRPIRPFTSAVVLPDRTGIVLEVADGCIRFTLDRPRHLTVLLDGTDQLALHLFISEPEKETPNPDDPNVIYFGPGLHEVDTIKVQDGQTVYLAGGAVVKGVLRPGEEGVYSEQWKVTFYHGTVLAVSGVTGARICGRGILDGSLVPHPGHQLVAIHQAEDIRVEGITLRDSPNWDMIIAKSRNVRVNDVRIVSGRLNSDGINSVNSRDVQIRRCFVRNHDDSIVVKTLEPDLPAEDILVEDCTVWSDWGYSFGVTYETRAPIHRVTFNRCDIVYARHWCLGVHLSDSATVSEIAFRDIDIADLATAPRLAGAHAALAPEPRLLRINIGRDVWGKDQEAGHVRDITVDGVALHGAVIPPSEIFGYDAEHQVEHVAIRNVWLNGEAVKPELTRNEFVSEISVK